MNRSIKTIFAWILTLALLFTCMPQFALHVKAADPSGECGQNTTWSYNEATGTLTITGSGDMYDNVPWEEYKDSIKTASFSEGVTSVASMAFYGCTNLVSVSIPNSMTDLGYSTFSGCSSLKSATIPDGVTELHGLFNNCSSLESVTIPESVTIIGNGTFEYCSSLKSVTIPNMVKTIDQFAFDGCSSLTSVTIPQSVAEIRANAFNNCSNLEKIIILSRDCVIEAENALGLPGVTTIYGIPGTTAQTYAAANGYTFAEINGCDYGAHNFEIVDEKVHTDTEAGWRKLRCADCGEEKTEQMPVGHDYKTIIGRDWYGEVVHCVYCDASYTTRDFPELKLGKLTNVDMSIGINIAYFTPEHSGTYSLTDETNHSIYVTLYDSQGRKLAADYSGFTDKPDLRLSAKLVAGQTYYYDISFDKGGDGCEGMSVDVILNELDERTGFTDVAKGAFYAEPVAWAVENNITKGTSTYTFSPDATCTRGQVVTFLWRAKGSPAPKSSDTGFTDLKAGAFYEKAVAWAVENNITSGMDKTHFAPDAGCTRGQVVTFLWRANGCPEPKSSSNPFIDVQKGKFYYKAVLWAVENGITNGMTKTSFAPDATCTRGQIVTFLYRDMAEK